MDAVGCSHWWYIGCILVDICRHLELDQGHHLSMELYCRLGPCLVSSFPISSKILISFQSLFSLVILTIEATPLTQWGPCQPYTEKITEKTANFKYWQRTIFYGVSGCLVYFFCTASAVANVAVFLLTMLVTFIYGFIVFKHKRMVSVF